VRPSRARAACRRSVPTRPRESKLGTLALGHPFAATGARILSQAVKELTAICTCEPFMHRTDGNAGIRALAPAWISSLDLEVALG
jgi:hypothetical protein